MCYVVSDTHHIYPRYFWTLGQKLTISKFVYLFNSLANCLNKHTIGSESLHTTRRQIIILGRLDICVPLLQLINSVVNLFEGSFQPISVIG